MSHLPDRLSQVRLGVAIEIMTVLWMIVEAAVSIGAGILATSALLIAFGLDSIIELISGGILLWRLALEAQGKQTEQVARRSARATWIVALSLALLCVYVLVTATWGLVTQARSQESLLGISMAVAAVLVMPVLGMSKRRIAIHIGGAALRGDAASSFTCGYMAGTVLLGVGFNALLHWWWAEDAASLIFLLWLIGETREAFEDIGGNEVHTC